MVHGLKPFALILLLSISVATSHGGVINPGGAGTIGTQTGATGRYIRVSINRPTGVAGAEPRLHISEIEAFLAGVTPVNGPTFLNNAQDVALASQGASYQSSVNAGITGGHDAGGATNAGRLIDGLEQGGGSVWSVEAVGGTSADVIIDLGQTRELGIVRVHPRDDCCFGRLSDFSVAVIADAGGDVPGTVASSRTFAAQAPAPAAAEVNLAGQLTIGAGDTLRMELQGLNADLLQLTDLTLLPGSTLEIVDLGGTSGTYQLFDITNPITGTFSNIILPSGSTFDLSNLYLTGQITLVPEPSVIAIWSIVGLAMAVFCWRRKVAGRITPALAGRR